VETIPLSTSRRDIHNPRRVMNAFPQSYSLDRISTELRAAIFSRTINQAYALHREREDMRR